MDRSLIIDTEKLDKKDVTIIKMSITIIALVGALLFSLYSNINLSAILHTIVEPLPTIMRQIIIVSIVFIVFLCTYISWRFTLGSKSL